MRSTLVGHPRRVPKPSLGNLRGRPWMDLRILEREMLLYSHKAVIGWRHPNLVPTWFRAKKEDWPRLMWRDVLLEVEDAVVLRIPRWRCSLTAYTFRPLIDCPSGDQSDCLLRPCCALQQIRLRSPPNSSLRNLPDSCTNHQKLAP